MANGLFQYTPTQTGVTTTVQQGQIRSTAGDDIKAIMGAVSSVAKVAGDIKATESKDRYIQASREANLAMQSYTEQVSQTNDVMAKRQHLDNYRTALDSIKTGYELDDEHALRFENATKAHLRNQTVAIEGLTNKYILDQTDEGISQGLMLQTGASPEDNSNFLKEATIAYEQQGLNPTQIGDRITNLLVNSKLATMSEDTDYATIKQAKADVRETVKQFDSKMVNKDSYKKAMSQFLGLENTTAQEEFKNLTLAKQSGNKDTFYSKLNDLESLGLIDAERKRLEKASFKEGVAKANTDAVRVYKQSDQIYGYEHSPQRVRETLSLFNKQDEAFIETYTREKQFYDTYNPMTTSSNLVDPRYETLAKRKAKENILKSLAVGDIGTALGITAKTNETGALRDLASGMLNKQDPSELSQGVDLLTQMYNTDGALVVNKLISKEDLPVFTYLRYVKETGGTISDGDVLRINEVKASKEQPYINFKEFSKEYGEDVDYIDKLSTYKALRKFGISEDKAMDYIDEHKETSVTSTVDMTGAGFSGYSKDQVDDAFTPVISGYQQLYATDDVTLRYDARTKSLWTYVDGYPRDNTGLDYNLMMDSYELGQREEKESSAFETAKANLLMRLDDATKQYRENVRNFSFHANPERVQELENFFSPQWWYGKIYGKGEK